MQEIKAWLKGGDYAAGIILYSKYGNNSFLKKQFAKQQNKYLEQKLREELVKISIHLKLAEITETGFDVIDKSPAASKILITPNSGELKQSPLPDKSELQKQYLQLVKKRQRLYTELNAYMEEKHHLPEGEKLRLCCVAILAHHRQITETYALTDHYEVHQKFPMEEKKPDIDPEVEIDLLRSAISKANKRLLNANCRNREKTQKGLDAKKCRLNELLAKRDQQ